MIPVITDTLDAVGNVSLSFGTGARGVGVTHFFANVPSVVLLVFGVITQLGDPWLLFVVLATFYWAGPQDLVEYHRRTWGTLTALAVGTTALTVGLKALFGLPRPPNAAVSTPPEWLPSVLFGVFHNLTTGTGFGFPSGHALGTTVVYGGMAYLLTGLWDRRRRAYAAAGLVGVVSLSRLVLGLHYLVDVVAGILVGLAFLAFVLRVSRNLPARAFLVGVAVSVVAMIITTGRADPDLTRQAAAAFGGCLGGLTAWLLLSVPSDHRVSIPEAVVGLSLTGGLWLAVYVLQPAPLVTAFGDAVAVAGLIAFPDAVELYRDPTDEERANPD